MSDDPNIADLRERRQRATESLDKHMAETKRSLRALGYDVVPTKRRIGRAIGYVLVTALGALSVALLIGAVGLALWLARWLLGML